VTALVPAGAAGAFDYRAALVDLPSYHDDYTPEPTRAWRPVIGAGITLPPLGFAVLPSFDGEGIKTRDVNLGPITNFPEGEYVIATFMESPELGEVSRRTAFVRNNGRTENGTPSFTAIYSRCVHLGCPVQANGPSGQILGLPTVKEKTKNGPVTFSPTVPAGFGCPCHGGQYDTEGNRTAGPPVRGLDRYEYSIKNGRLVLGSAYSVDYVRGAGKDARIKKYPLHNPGQHVAGPEFWLWPIPEIRA